MVAVAALLVCSLGSAASGVGGASLSELFGHAICRVTSLGQGDCGGASQEAVDEPPGRAELRRLLSGWEPAQTFDECMTKAVPQYLERKLGRAPSPPSSLEVLQQQRAGESCAPFGLHGDARHAYEREHTACVEGHAKNACIVMALLERGLPPDRVEPLLAFFCSGAGAPKDGSFCDPGAVYSDPIANAIIIDLPVAFLTAGAANGAKALLLSLGEGGVEAGAEAAADAEAANVLRIVVDDSGEVAGESITPFEGGIEPEAPVGGPAEPGAGQGPEAGAPEAGGPGSGSSPWVDSSGQPIWPPNRGFVGEPVKEVLGTGTRIDRYGFRGGTFASPEGTPYAARALAPGTASKPYEVYEVVKPIDVDSGIVAPWFGEAGGGFQYELPRSVEWLLDNGYLKVVR
jgi:hypothetical protein